MRGKLFEDRIWNTELGSTLNSRTESKRCGRSAGVLPEGRAAGLPPQTNLRTSCKVSDPATTHSEMKNSISTFSRAIKLLTAALLLPACLTFTSAAQANAATAQYNLGKNQLALEGYDPVTYFTQNKAVKGRAEIATQHRGATYWFASDEDRKLFTAAPEKYLPAYGGWCATAMAKGEKVEIDPANFKVTNGRLFLFFKAFYANAIKDWNKDEPNLTTKADANWKRISGE